MKILAIIGSPTKNHTYNATKKLLKNMQSLGDVEYEMLNLNQYNLKICIGCRLCLDKGENSCPLADDRDIIIQKMLNSDGVIFASPNYSFHVSGLMKVFLDRLGYFFHRPEFFGKTFTSIVVQGVYGGKYILKYFNFIGKALGFNRVKGICINTMEPISEKVQKKNNYKIEKLTKKFYLRLLGKKYPKPSIFDLMVFRLSRTSMKLMLNEEFYDYKHFSKENWFSSDYYYPVKLNPLKKLFGKLFDIIAVKIAK